MAASTNRIPSLIQKQLNEQDNFLKKIKSDLVSIDLNYKQMDSVLKAISSVVSENKRCIEFLLQQASTNAEKIVANVFGHCINSLQSMDSHYKR